MGKIEKHLEDEYGISEKTLEKIIVGFYRIICIETMHGEYILEDDSKVKGKASYISKVSGDIEINKECFESFAKGIIEDDWDIFVDKFYDFDGEGKGNEYELEEFEDFEESDSGGCVFEDTDPSECFLVFSDGTKVECKSMNQLAELLDNNNSE